MSDGKSRGEGAGQVSFHIYEVFAQHSHGEPHVHIGSVLAESGELAVLLARENHLRRDGCVNLWAVRRDHIHATSYEDPDFFARELDRSYREPAGYPENARRWQKYRRQAMQIDELTKD